MNFVELPLTRVAGNPSILVLDLAVPILIAFVLFSPSSKPSTFFADVYASDPYYNIVNEMGLKGISSACSPGYYCPSAVAVRQDAAVFFVRGNQLKCDASLFYPRSWRF